MAISKETALQYAEKLLEYADKNGVFVVYKANEDAGVVQKVTYSIAKNAQAVDIEGAEKELEENEAKKTKLKEKKLAIETEIKKL